MSGSKKTYCSLGFGNNYFYPLGTDSLPIPPTLLLEDGEGDADNNNDGGDNSEKRNIVGGHDECGGGTQVSLLPINPHANGKSTDEDEQHETPTSASEWIRSHLPSQPPDGKNNNTKYSANFEPSIACGTTHTSFIIPKNNYSQTSSSTTTAQHPSGEAYLVGTIFGHAYQKLTVQPTRLPLKIVRISSGRRHVLALTEGASPGGGVVMSWGAGHFGQLGHGPDLTSCLEPRIVERLLPHVVDGNVVEIAAGGLHSAAIVVPSSRSSTTNQKVLPNGDGRELIIRETKTFAWGSNRKGQCGIEGGKCATVPEPLPVITVKREEASKRDGGGGNNKTMTDPIDKVVHFEKLSLGRLHTVALTAYGEVFTWGSTSMGRCGHNPAESGSRGSDRRFVQQPRHVSALRNVVIEGIAAGDAHSLALSKGGRVFAWGAGGDGQCAQGHAGNLFSPRPVLGLPTGSTTTTLVSEKYKKLSSKVAMEVTMEEEALSKALSMSQINNAPPSSGQETKSDKIVSIRASGCYSAAITANGEVYTWGYGGSGAAGHPIPSSPEEESRLPLIPLIEGNQYSTATAAKVYPEGGSDENKIRDCRCFDTDLNVMLPRKVECTRRLGLRAEEVSLGPGHMVITCSLRDTSEDDRGMSNESQAGQPPHSSADAGQDSSETDVTFCSSRTEAECSPSGPAQALSTPDASNRELEDIDTSNTFESNDSSKSERQKRSPSWMPKIKSPLTTGSSNKSLQGQEGEKKKSFMNMVPAALRRGGEK